MIIEARIRIMSGKQGQDELLRCLLVQAGIPIEKISQKQEKGRLSVSVFLESSSEARKTADVLRGLKLKNISFSLIPLKDSDWKTRWKKYFKPFNITRGVRVIPVWEQGESAPGGMEGIRLDTTFAFGTGLHATTRMMADFIRMNRRGIGSLLDVGTGSGILSLVACRYGIKDIWAIDNDPESVRTARVNFRRNGCPDRHLSAADFSGLRLDRSFDMVAANLFTEDLVRFRRKLFRLVSPGGFLAVSGIFHENYASFRRRFRIAGLRVVEARRRSGWYAVLLKKKAGGK